MEEVDTTPILIHYTGDNDDISDADKQEFMKMVIDENTFKDKKQFKKKIKYECKYIGKIKK